MEATLEAVVLCNASRAFCSSPKPGGAPSFGDSWSETSPSEVLYHWHWKSFFQISAGSGSAGLVVLSSSSEAFDSPGLERKGCEQMETSVMVHAANLVERKLAKRHPNLNSLQSENGFTYCGINTFILRKLANPEFDLCF